MRRPRQRREVNVGAEYSRKGRLRRRLASIFILVSTLSAVFGVVATQAQADTLWAGQYLCGGQSKLSPDGQYWLVMQGDGNFVLYTWQSNGVAVWASNTSGWYGSCVFMQGDGNLTIYWFDSQGGGHLIWQSNTSGSGGQYISVQDDGNVVMYTSSGAVPWASGSYNCKEWGKNNCDRNGFSEAEESYWGGIAAPVTNANVYAMTKWAAAENTMAQCNPLATTQYESGSWNFNSIGVKNYQNYNGQTCWYWGVLATAQTIQSNNPGYGNIRSVLWNPSTDPGTQCRNLGAAVGNSGWGTSDFSSTC